MNWKLFPGARHATVNMFVANNDQSYARISEKYISEATEWGNLPQQTWGGCRIATFGNHIQFLDEKGILDGEAYHVEIVDERVKPKSTAVWD